MRRKAAVLLEVRIGSEGPWLKRSGRGGWMDLMVRRKALGREGQRKRGGRVAAMAVGGGRRGIAAVALSLFGESSNGSMADFTFRRCRLIAAKCLAKSCHVHWLSLPAQRFPPSPIERVARVRDVNKNTRTATSETSYSTFITITPGKADRSLNTSFGSPRRAVQLLTTPARCPLPFVASEKGTIQQESPHNGSHDARQSRRGGRETAH